MNYIYGRPSLIAFLPPPRPPQICWGEILNRKYCLSSLLALSLHKLSTKSWRKKSTWQFTSIDCELFQPDTHRVAAYLRFWKTSALHFMCNYFRWLFLRKIDPQCPFSLWVIHQPSHWSSSCWSSPCAALPLAGKRGRIDPDPCLLRLALLSAWKFRNDLVLQGWTQAEIVLPEHKT